MTEARRRWAAVLFDLDGTLVETSAAFYRDTLGRLDDPALARATLAATEAVRIHGPAPQPVGERILAGIAERLDADVRRLAERFAVFYRDVYPQLSGGVRPIAGAGDLLAAAAASGARLALASDPVFPAQQLRQRLVWGGLEPSCFAHLPGCDEARALKPNTAYYADLASALGVDPHDCLLIGNDAERDGAALAAGMRVFLLTGPRHGVTDRPGVPQTPPPGVQSGGLLAALRLLTA